MRRRRRTLVLATRRALAACVFIIVLANLLGSAARAAEPGEHRRRIYFLESLAPTQPAAIGTIDAFQKRIAELTSERFDIFIDYMELERFPGQAHIDSTVRYLTEKYAESPSDLLIPLGRAAIPFMVKYRDTIAPGVPLIMANMPARAVADGSALDNTVWVATEYSFANTLALAQALQPKARNLAIVAGASDYDRSWVDDARRELAEALQKYQVTYLTGLPHGDLLRRVSELPSDTIVLMSFVFADGDGLARVPPEVAEAVAKASAAPVYSPVSSFFGRGIVGGYMDSFEAHGVAAANLAGEILAGTPIAELGHQTEPAHQYEVDARALERWGLSARQLPDDAVVAFRQPTIWQEHPYLLLAAMAAFVLQTALLCVLLIQRHRRIQAEAEASEQRREVAHLMRVSVLGELSGAIAHEINQPLTAILSNAQAALALLEQASPDLAEVRDAINDIVHEDNRAGDVIVQLRNLLRKGERKSEPIDVNDLVTSTIALLNSEVINRQVKVETELAAALPETVGDRVQVQQVLLNLLMNAMDAMAATQEAFRRIKVTTRVGELGAIEVSIRDRGHGIKADHREQLFKPFYTTKPHGLGLGLTICSTIAQAHGGKLSLANHADKGAVAIFSLPAHLMRSESMPF